MADFHTKSFFGVENGLIINSPARIVPWIFISCIKRKGDGTWEKISKGEGKTVKLSIEEIICIVEVLRKNSANWRGYHVFKEYKTEIYVGWEDNSREILQFKIGDYKKKLRFPNTTFLTLLLEHILSEKIEFATSTTYKTKVEASYNDQFSVFAEQIKGRDGLQVVETTEYDIFVETYDIKAKIKVESPKALLIMCENGKEFWIPKSTIHNKYNIDDKKQYQKLIVDKWIIEKNRAF
ncbi:MAG: hypothetical protein ACTSPD_01125 [Promethearchaeota archaeon]